ncbi:MAG: glycosyltransferase family 2 protein [bacterium]
MNEAPVSACVITLNEEGNIGRCLRSLQWVDEILVVDSGSDDDTVEIAESLGARVLYNDWPGYRDQKQFAADNAKNDWILSIDADEEVSNELRKSINTTVGDSPDPRTSYKVNRKCQFLGRWIEHGSWYPDWVLRLFNRRKTEWVGGDLHEHVQPTETVEFLDGNLYHYPYENISENVEYGNYYSAIQSRELHRKGRSSGLFTALGHGSFKFFKDYILKRGFMDGMPGFVIATIGSFNVFLKYAKLWEKNHTDTSGNPDYPRS